MSIYGKYINNILLSKHYPAETWGSLCRVDCAQGDWERLTVLKNGTERPETVSSVQEV